MGILGDLYPVFYAWYPVLAQLASIRGVSAPAVVSSLASALGKRLLSGKGAAEPGCGVG